MHRCLNFKYRDVKMFLLKLGSELQNSIKKFQSPPPNYPLLVEIVDKTDLPNSMFRPSSSFTVLFTNHVFEIKIVNVFVH